MGPCDTQQFTALQDTKTLNITDHLKVNQKTLGKWSRHWGAFAQLISKGLERERLDKKG